MVEIITFGCRLNSYESEVMRLHAEASGLKNAVIINSCTVTAEAERQLRQTIRKIRREKPDAFIVLTGCAAQVDAEKYAAMPEVDRVVGNSVKMRPDVWRFAGDEKIIIADMAAEGETGGQVVHGFEGKARAFVQVQQGCDWHCTFCIIPAARGHSRSIPYEAVLAQAKTLVAEGYKEIVLSGVDISSYRPSLSSLIRRLLADVPELPRLRVSSLDPAAVEDDFIRLLADELRLMPHLHLSLQAGDDMVLKRMGRRHTRGQVLELVARLRAARPDIVLGADLIAGFPTETDEMAANTLRLVEEAGLALLHVFPFSPRPGTPAAKMPQVPVSVRRQRAADLRVMGQKILQAQMEAFCGKTVAALVETPALARTDHFLPVLLDMPQNPGDVVKVMLNSVQSEHFAGHVVPYAGP